MFISSLATRNSHLLADAESVGNDHWRIKSDFYGLRVGTILRAFENQAAIVSDLGSLFGDFKIGHCDDFFWGIRQKGWIVVCRKITWTRDFSGDRMAKLVIFGCGRGADVAVRYFTGDSAHQVCGFAVEKKYLVSDAFRGLPLVDFAAVERHFPPSDFQMFVPLGYQRMNNLRAQKYTDVKQKGYVCASYVSSKVVSHDELRVGENCFVLENNTINYDVRIGNNVVIWSACQLGDQSVIGDHVWISSHAALAGEVTVGEYSFLGVNCTISNYVKIARKSYIGAGAFIAQDTVEKGVYVIEGTRRFNVESDQFLALLESMQKRMHE